MAAGDIRAGGAYVELGAGTDKLNKQLKQAEKGVKDFAANAAKAAAAIAGVGLGMMAMFKQTLDAFGEQQRVEAQLDAALRSTQGAVGMTAEELKGLAKELQMVTAYGDETTLHGMNLLLTFTKIGKDVFPQATEAMMDMSTRMRTDLKSSAILIGKALNDPTYGLSMLSRVGVKFTDQQTDMIRTMWEAGDVIGAQKEILKELHTEFGGSARAELDTYVGQMAQIKNEFGDLKENIGEAIAPTKEFMIKVRDILIQAKEWVKNNQEIVRSFARLTAFVTLVAGAIAILMTTVLIILSPFAAWVAFIALTTVGILALMEALFDVNTGLTDFLSRVTIGQQSLLGYAEVFLYAFVEAIHEIGAAFMEMMEKVSTFFHDKVMWVVDKALGFMQKVGLISESTKEKASEGFDKVFTKISPLANKGMWAGAKNWFQDNAEFMRNEQDMAFQRDRDRLAEYEKQKNKDKKEGPKFAVPEIPMGAGGDMKSGIIGIIGGMSIGEQLGGIGKSIEKDQLNELEKQTTALDEIKKTLEDNLQQAGEVFT